MHSLFPTPSIRIQIADNYTLRLYNDLKEDSKITNIADHILWYMLPLLIDISQL